MSSQSTAISSQAPDNLKAASRQAEEVGYVISSRNFIVYLDGMPNIRVNDLVESENGVKGWVHGVYKDRAEVLILDETHVSPGQMFRRVNKQLEIGVGDYLMGRVINPLGAPLDTKGILATTKKAGLSLDRQATGIYSRQFINDQFISGLSVIDTLIPLGKGQRELIMGDAHSGKTSFLLNLIINQKNTGVISIYASIGKPILQAKSLIDTLEANDALANTIIISATSSDPAPLIFLTPQTALSIAEYFQQKGRDVLLILDDMGNHAKIYREMSLLDNRPPGRESYPGDVFYQHSHLMERAGKFNPKYGGGSITALPVIEVTNDDYSDFIPTNLMSMTDGHLTFKSSLNNQGQRPAIDISTSVSRVGRQTQLKVQNSLSAKLRQVLAQAAALETVSQFSSELPYETQNLLNQKDQILELIKQHSLTFIPLEVQTILLGLVFTSLLKDQKKLFITKYKQSIIDNLASNPHFTPLVSSIKQLTTVEELIVALEPYVTALRQVCK